jgi:glycosyltransferase involved in cell wall biosynthesis
MGGVEQHVYEVASRLAAAGLAVTVLTTDLDGRLPPLEVQDGVEIRRVRAWPAKGDYFFAPGIYEAIRRGDWDIVHVQSYHTFVAPLTMLAAVRGGVPFVLTFHGGGHSSRLRHWLRPLQLRLLGPLLGRAERLVAVAHFEIELYGRTLNLRREKFVLIPNGSNLYLQAAAGSVKRSPSLIVSIGRLERYKGHHRILAALPEILARQPDARLWIAGAGPYEGELRRLTTELDVSACVKISAVPPADRARMAQLLSEAAVVVLLSEFETHPLAVVEALAMGARAVVTDVAGLRELAQHGLARAVPADSSSRDIAAAVLGELGQSSNDVRLQLPTWDQCASDLLSLYESIVARQPKASRSA